MSQPSLYALLGLDRNNFTPEQLRRRYRALAMRWHPDRNRGNEAFATEKFKEVHRAYEVLSDPVLRHEYDVSVMMHRARGEPGTPRPPAPPPPPRPPPQDPKTKKAWEEALRSDEWSTSSARHQRSSAAEEAATESNPAAEAAVGGVHEWEGLAAALDASAREAEMEGYVFDDDEIEAAVREVEEAMRREEEEMQEALRAVEAAAASEDGGATDTIAKAEAQLAALMAMGVHAEVAEPLCDGVSSVEELVELLI